MATGMHLPAAGRGVELARWPMFSSPSPGHSRSHEAYTLDDEDRLDRHGISRADGVGGGSPVGADELQTQPVVGGWIGALPCLITSVAPTSSSPTTVPLECVSSTTFTGSWTGHTVYRLSGVLDLLTGDLHGFVDETLVGVVTSTRAAGTLHLVGPLVVDGATSTVVVRERIVGGTGAFLGSSGIVEFVGLAVGGVGQGGYHGTWTHS